MPKINFRDVDDVQGFTPLPEGKYLCRLVEVEESSTQYGDEMWRLRFVVESGPQRGRYVFDNMVFSAAAMKRAKLICSRLGLDVAGELDLKPAAIQGRLCSVMVEIEEYQDQEGQTRFRNVVPFAGYESAETKQAGRPKGEEEDSDEALPF